MASKNIVLKGATWNGVESVDFPVSGGGTALYVETSDADATASDIASGKKAYVNGSLIVGSATAPVLTTKSITQNGTYNASSDSADGYSSVTVNVSGGGGGGLEYETGTWTPENDIANYTISFARTHTVAPFFYLISDATNTYSSTTNSNFCVAYYNFEQSLGADVYVSSTTMRYGEVRVIYRGTSETSLGNTTTNIQYPYTSQEDNLSTYPRYWATETGIKAYTISTSRYWRADRTYKWIAVWAPTS